MIDVVERAAGDIVRDAENRRWSGHVEKLAAVEGKHDHFSRRRHLAENSTSFSFLPVRNLAIRFVLSLGPRGHGGCGREDNDL